MSVVVNFGVAVSCFRKLYVARKVAPNNLVRCITRLREIAHSSDYPGAVTWQHLSPFTTAWLIRPDRVGVWRWTEVVVCVVYWRGLKGAVVRLISCNVPLNASRLFGINALDGSLFHCAIVQGKKLYICSSCWRWIFVCICVGGWSDTISK